MIRPAFAAFRVLFVCLLCKVPAFAGATPLEPGVVEFSYTHETKDGHAVVVAGAHDALGANDPLRAIRLARGEGHRWSARVALPAGEKIRYRFHERDFRSTAWGDRENFHPLGEETEIEVPGQASPKRPRGIALWKDWERAWIRFRPIVPPAEWREVEMTRGLADKSTVFTLGEEHKPPGEIEFVFHNGQGEWLNAPPPPREPARAAAPEVPLPYQNDRPPWNFRCRLDHFHVRHGQIYAANPPEKPLAPRFEVLPVPGRGEIPGRPLKVWLPRDYEKDGTRSYPFVLFHDGQNVFFPGGNFGTWDADRIATHEISNGRMAEAILVAIPNGNDHGSDRLIEYLPEGEKLDYGGKTFEGRASAYLEWLTKDVIPTLEKHIRVMQNPKARYLAGSSMGGLITDFEGGRGDGPIRGSFGIFSPAYWAAPRWTASERARTRDGIPRFISMGTAESSRGESGSDTYWNGALEALDRRVREGTVYGNELRFRGLAAGRHNEAAWAALLPEYFCFALPADGR